MGLNDHRTHLVVHILRVYDLLEVSDEGLSLKTCARNVMCAGSAGIDGM